MGSICRLCLHKNDQDVMKNIFEFRPKYFELNLTEILYWIFDVEIIVEDTYSKFVCNKCLKVIESIGRYRKFFQVNQTFLHERRCPTDYEVQSGWYNTRDIGTNTEFKEDLNYIKISVRDLNALHKPQINLVQDGESKTGKLNKSIEKASLKQNKDSQEDINKVTQNNRIELVNVTISTLEEFLKTTTINKNLERIDVPKKIFDYCSFPVPLPDLKEACTKQGYTQLGNTFYKLTENSLYIPLKNIESNGVLLRHYRKIGKFTYKKIPRLRKCNRIRLQRKKELIQDYYRMPTSALRELITETNPKKNKQLSSVTSLVTTNEVNVQVCKYCSCVFKSKQNLKHHIHKFHKRLMHKKKHTNHLQHKYAKLVARKHTTGFIKTSQTSSNFSENCLTDESDNDNGYNNPSLSLENVKNKSGSILENDKSDQVNDGLCELEINEREIIVDENRRTYNKSDEKDRLDVSSQSSEKEHESWLRVKDIKDLQNEQPSSTEANDNLHMDYLKTVLFGDCSEATPKVTYHYDGSPNLNDHNYANKLENVPLKVKKKRRKNSGKPFNVKKTHGKPLKTKMTPDDCKKSRKILEKLKKIRFALFNEIQSSSIVSSIESSLAALQKKLKIQNRP